MNEQTIDKNIDLGARNGTTELEAQVLCRLGGQLHDFQLEIRDKGIVMRGHTHTYYAKQLAQHAVMEATDLPILSNNIEVF